MLRDCTEDGTELVKSAPYMTKADQERIACLLFEMDNPNAHGDRAINNLQRQTVGRISEVSVLQPQQLTVLECSICLDAPATSILMPITIVKIMLYNRLAFSSIVTVGYYVPIMHLPRNWLLAVQRVTHFPPMFARTNIAVYVNGILKNLAEKDPELREYTSHAVKRRAATDAIGHPQINASWVVLRAGWKADAISTFFSYLTLRPESDSYVEKALAGWNSLDRGGASPTINSLSPDQRESFTEYAVHLLSLGGGINREVKVNLAGVLVLWYRDVKHKYPTCSLP